MSMAEDKQHDFNVLDTSIYPAQLDEKSDRLRQLFAEFQPPELEVHASEPSHFRLRAEFRLWHEGDRCYYAMFKPGNKSKAYEVKEFPIASQLINRLMQQLLVEIQPNELLRRQLFQVEFLTTMSGDALITLIYHKKLDDAWQAEAEALQQRLGFPIVGRSRKQKLVLERDYVNETLQVDGKAFHYRQIEGGFTQPNGGLNQQMLSWARSASDAFSGDLLELYCGNGNFSVALADKYDRVLATEISKTSVAAAQINIRDNALDNLIIARLSSEEFVQAIRGERTFTRLGDVDLTSYNFDTVLVDPPRAGLDDESVRQISEYNNIIYISCNPDTLHSNLTELCKTHTITRFAMFDQFPYTHHIETGVVLTRRSANKDQ
ncbi:MAG: tRNA (uridine(54)-C5)-methyltransferase TrmA [Thalassolituus oleivorans]|uniref:tRNA (uridine(54)-C5)-methyltransferase TrmA n=1 Tax=Thalassolituus oleivorans TaxID=187493 RepID=UPI001B6F9C5E|nr:tRNA (uridine(54)-C5)-methyltransferase TrmA [Thalassolituus oleivorans]MBQ0727913.1 tRNA (uridine(54)-C5)-methyltransferase TrmA [Thalassolituus oleivorans]